MLIIVGTRTYAVNRRYTMVILSIGGHNRTAQTFAGNMDLPAPVQSYSDHVQVICQVVKHVAKESMKRAAAEAEEQYGKTIWVSCNGTWQRREFSSKNGVATVLTNVGKDNGSKAVDTEVLTTYCSTCS